MKLCRLVWPLSRFFSFFTCGLLFTFFCFAFSGPAGDYSFSMTTSTGQLYSQSCL